MPSARRASERSGSVQAGGPPIPVSGPRGPPEDEIPAGPGYTLQLMSSPQHCGDLILPCPSGHFAMSTEAPPSSCSVSCTSSLLHLPQVMVPTLIPHFGQLYIATVGLLSMWNRARRFDGRFDARWLRAAELAQRPDPITAGGLREGSLRTGRHRQAVVAIVRDEIST